MTTPKQHHYVPKWYLERFTDNTGFLHVYDGRTRLFRRQKPQNVMTMNRYYRQSWAPEGIDPDILEKTLGTKIEPQAKKAFDKLLTGEAGVIEEDTAAILLYLEFQHIRVPRQTEFAKQLLKTTIHLQSPPEEAESILQDIMDINGSFRFDFMRTVSGNLYPWFASMDWEIIEATDGLSFITTDSPVSFYNVDFLPPTEAGLGLVGTMVLFPINSRYLLILRHPEYTGRDKISPSMRLPIPKIKDGHIEISFNHKFSHKEVTKYNWTMWQLSYQMIVGNSRGLLNECIGHLE